MADMRDPMLAPNQLGLDAGRNEAGYDTFNESIIDARRQWCLKRSVQLDCVGRVGTVGDGVCHVFDDSTSEVILASASQIEASLKGDTILAIGRRPIASIAADCGVVVWMAENWRAIMHISAVAGHNGVFEQFAEQARKTGIALTEAHVFVGPVLEQDRYEVDPEYEPVKTFAACGASFERGSKIHLGLNDFISYKIKRVLGFSEDQIDMWLGAGTWNHPLLWSHRQTGNSPRGHQFFLLT